MDIVTHRARLSVIYDVNLGTLGILTACAYKDKKNTL